MNDGVHTVQASCNLLACGLSLRDSTKGIDQEIFMNTNFQLHEIRNSNVNNWMAELKQWSFTTFQFDYHLTFSHIDRSMIIDVIMFAFAETKIKIGLYNDHKHTCTNWHPMQTLSFFSYQLIEIAIGLQYRKYQQ